MEWWCRLRGWLCCTVHCKRIVGLRAGEKWWKIKRLRTQYDVVLYNLATCALYFLKFCGLAKNCSINNLTISDYTSSYIYSYTFHLKSFRLRIIFWCQNRPDCVAFLFVKLLRLFSFVKLMLTNGISNAGILRDNLFRLYLRVQYYYWLLNFY